MLFCVMGTAVDLQSFMCLDDLLLGTHRNDAIFSVVSLRTMPNGKEIIYNAVPSSFSGSFRWACAECVEDAFKTCSNGYLTGAEARGAIYANPTQRTFLLWRSLDNISLIQTT